MNEPEEKKDYVGEIQFVISKNFDCVWNLKHNTKKDNTKYISFILETPQKQIN